MSDSQKAYEGVIETPETEAERAQLQQLELIAELLDRKFLDPVMGILFPGAGNTLSSLIGLYGIFVAVNMSVHPVIIARMFIHLALDSFISSIPLIGWLGDFFYRAHVYNLELLRNRGTRGEASTGDWVFVLFAAGLFLLALATPILVVLFLGYWLLSSL